MIIMLKIVITTFKISLTSLTAGQIHDSILLWAYGVNRTLQQGFSPDDGAKIFQNVINLTFEGITGSVTIDENGDRKSNYIVQMVQNGTVSNLIIFLIVSKFPYKIHFSLFYILDITGADWT